jgi:hypothetical protein
VDISEKEFRERMAADQQELNEMFSEGHRLENEINEQLKRLKFDEEVGK